MGTLHYIPYVCNIHISNTNLYMHNTLYVIKGLIPEASPGGDVIGYQ